MRATYNADPILGTRSRLAVLRVLAGAKVPLNASQIATRTRLSWPAVTRVLDDLATMGIVNSSSAGQANVHTLNRENVYVRRLVLPLFDAEDEVAAEMISDLRATFEPHVLAAAVFGSYARESQDATSDLDIALVVERGDKESVEALVDDYQADFLSRFGSPLSAIVYDTTEAAALARAAPSLAAELVRDAEVLSGPHPREWSTAWPS